MIGFFQVTSLKGGPFSSSLKKVEYLGVTLFYEAGYNGDEEHRLWSSLVVQQVKDPALSHSGSGHCCGKSCTPALGMSTCHRHSLKKIIILRERECRFWGQAAQVLYTCVCMHTWTHTHTNTHTDLLWRFGSRDYGGWRVLPLAIGKLETQESPWRNLVWTQRPENQDKWWCNPHPRAGDQCPRPNRQEGNKSSLALFLHFIFSRPLGDWMVTAHDGVGSLLHWVHQFRCLFYPEMMVIRAPCVWPSQFDT